MPKKKKWFQGIEDSMLMTFVWHGWKLSCDRGMYCFEIEIDGHVGQMFAENSYCIFELPDQSSLLMKRLLENYDRFDQLFTIDGEEAGKCSDSPIYNEFRDFLELSLDHAEGTRIHAWFCFSDKDREYLSNYVKNMQDYINFGL